MPRVFSPQVLGEHADKPSESSPQVQSLSRRPKPLPAWEGGSTDSGAGGQGSSHLSAQPRSTCGHCVHLTIPCKTSSHGHGHIGD